MTTKRVNTPNTTNLIIGAIIMALGVIAVFWLARSIFRILAFLAPVLLLITAIIDHKIIINYVKMIINLFKRNPIVGIVATVLTIIGFPIVSAMLFGRAMMGRQVKKMTEGAKIEYTSYEEVVEEEPETLELLEPKKEKVPAATKKSTDDSAYDQFFD